MFGLGIQELIIIGLIMLIPIGIIGAIVVVFVVASGRKTQMSNPNLTPCPDCGNLLSQPRRYDRMENSPFSSRFRDCRRLVRDSFIPQYGRRHAQARFCRFSFCPFREIVLSVITVNSYN